MFACLLLLITDTGCVCHSPETRVPTAATISTSVIRMHNHHYHRQLLCLSLPHSSTLSISDYVLDEAVKILRLLHIRDLRQLQSKINEALVSVQQVTADPKTDQKLGKIGR